MSGQLFASTTVPTVIVAALLLAEPAGAQFPPPPPPPLPLAGRPLLAGPAWLPPHAYGYRPYYWRGYYPYYAHYPYYTYYPHYYSHIVGEAQNDPATADSSYQTARRAFEQGDYAAAQRECERAMRLLPGDATLHEFLALCQFAQGRYTDAAATLRPVLADRPGWDWNTLSSFYPGVPTYTAQLRVLERFVRLYPRDQAARFVLAYHYLALDERDAADRQLLEAGLIQPRVQPSPSILKTRE